MAEPITEPVVDIAALNREKARLRWIGAIVLALGLISAGILYWARSRDTNLDQLRESQARAESRQMQLLYGSSGGLTSDLSSALKRPANQALIIVAISGLIAAGCFFLSRPLPENEDTQ